MEVGVIGVGVEFSVVDPERASISGGVGTRQGMRCEVGREVTVDFTSPHGLAMTSGVIKLSEYLLFPGMRNHNPYLPARRG